MTRVKNWPLLSSRYLQDFRIFKLRADTFKSPRTGKESEFFVFDVPDWINVIALDEADNLILIEQFRHGTAELSLEIPGGMMDEGDPSPEHAARRELLEETGYEAESWEYLGAVEPNPAIQTNTCHMFLALGARQVQEQQLDSEEDIAVSLKSLDQVPKLIQSGAIRHSLVIAAFHYLLLHDGRAASLMRV